MSQYKLECPSCGSRQGRCIETRNITFGQYHFILRKRACDRCGYQYRTKEVTEDTLVESNKNPNLQLDTNSAKQADKMDKELSKAEQITEDLKSPPLPPEIQEPPIAPFETQEGTNTKYIPIGGDQRKKEKRGRPKKEAAPSPPITGDDIFPPLE